MGFETALAFGAGSQLAGTVLGYGEQRAARKRQEAASNAGVALTQGANPVDQLIMQKLSAPNTGQDGFLQYLRANPGGLKPFMFNYSDAFKDLQANDAFNTQDQVNGLRSSVGSLGERFGSGFAGREALLRGRIAGGIQARNAGIAQNSFNTALQFGQSGYAMGQQQNNALLGLLLNSQQTRTGQQLQALGLAGQPLPGTAGVVSQGGADISQLLLLKQYLSGGMGGGGGVGSLGTVGTAPGQFNPWVY